MLISISKKSPLVKTRCLEIAFGDIILKTLLRPNSRAPSVLSKEMLFVKKNLSYKKVMLISISKYNPLVKNSCVENCVCPDNL